MMHPFVCFSAEDSAVTRAMSFWLIYINPSRFFSFLTPQIVHWLNNRENTCTRMLGKVFSHMSLGQKVNLSRSVMANWFFVKIVIAMHVFTTGH